MIFRVYYAMVDWTHRTPMPQIITTWITCVLLASGAGILTVSILEGDRPSPEMAFTPVHADDLPGLSGDGNGLGGVMIATQEGTDDSSGNSDDFNQPTGTQHSDRPTTTTGTRGVTRPVPQASTSTEGVSDGGVGGAEDPGSTLGQDSGPSSVPEVEPGDGTQPPGSGGPNTTVYRDVMPEAEKCKPTTTTPEAETTTTQGEDDGGTGSTNDPGGSGGVGGGPTTDTTAATDTSGTQGTESEEPPAAVETSEGVLADDDSQDHEQGTTSTEGAGVSSGVPESTTLATETTGVTGTSD